MPAIAHQNKILGNTSGGGSTILVTTSESSLYGQTITLSDGTTTLSGTFSNTGECEFTGVMMTGNLTLACSGVSQTVSVPYFGNYSFVFSLFSATVNVTYPYTEGATCTLSDGTTTLIATGSPMAFTVPNAGTWTATVTLDGINKTDSATITTDGQTANITIAYGTINLTYSDEFRGSTITCVNGGTTITKTAPSAGNTMVFYPPTTGSWTISGTVSGTPYSTTANVTSLSTPVSVTLETIPDGSTTTPTDDIQKWLACAGINDKAYTTVAQVLADTTTLLALISDNNAVDYMVRSTTWASDVCADSTAMTDIGANNYCADTLLADATWLSAIANSTYFESVLNVKVPVMTGATTPSGEVTQSSEYSGRNGWKAFSGGVSSSSSYGWCAATKTANSWVQYDFPTSVKVCKVIYQAALSGGFSLSLILQGVNDGTPADVGTLPTISDNNTHSASMANGSSYTGYRIVDTTGDTYNSYGLKLQFYGRAS